MRNEGEVFCPVRGGFQRERERERERDRKRERESPTNTLLYRTGSRVVRRFVLWAHLAPESVRFGEPCVVGRHILVEADRTRFTGFRCVVELHTLFTQSCKHY